MGLPFNSHWYLILVPLGFFPVFAVSVLGRLEIQLFMVGEVSDFSSRLGAPTEAEAEKFGMPRNEVDWASGLGALKAEPGNKPKISKVAEPVARYFLKRFPDL
jgi:hypothetical protein